MFSITLILNILITAGIVVFKYSGACYAKFDAGIPTQFNIDALQHLPTNYNIQPNLPNNFTITARIPSKYSLNPNIPNNFTLNTNVPTNFSIHPNLPNSFRFSFDLPSNFSLHPNIPNDFTIKGDIPTKYSLDLHVPKNFNVDVNVPSDFSFTFELPESISAVTKALGYVVAAYIGLLAANLLLKLLRDFIKSLVELITLLAGIYRRCFRKRSGSNLSHLSRENEEHYQQLKIRSPSKEVLCKDFEDKYP